MLTFQLPELIADYEACVTVKFDDASEVTVMYAPVDSVANDAELAKTIEQTFSSENHTDSMRVIIDTLIKELAPAWVQITAKIPTGGYVSRPSFSYRNKHERKEDEGNF